jgi:hypothetical protein
MKGRQYSYLPMTFNRAVPTPSHWRHLALDAKTWGAEVTNEAYVRGMKALGIDRQELHRRLERRWGILAGLNRKGAGFLDRALASDPKQEAIEDLRFLETSFRVYQPLIDALEQFHGALRLRFAGQDPGKRQSALKTALASARQAQKMADESFPQPIDPIGAEVGSLRRHARRLVESIEMWSKQEGKQ